MSSYFEDPEENKLVLNLIVYLSGFAVQEMFSVVDKSFKRSNPKPTSKDNDRRRVFLKLLKLGYLEDSDIPYSRWRRYAEFVHMRTFGGLVFPDEHTTDLMASLTCLAKHVWSGDGGLAFSWECLFENETHTTHRNRFAANPLVKQLVDDWAKRLRNRAKELNELETNALRVETGNSEELWGFVKHVVKGDWVSSFENVVITKFVGAILGSEYKTLVDSLRNELNVSSLQQSELRAVLKSKTH